MNKVVALTVPAWIGILLMSFSSAVRGQYEFDRDPIRYEATPARDRVAQLIEELESGTTQLHYDERHGWLPSLLERFQIDAESQTLVFSKTSLQIHQISPRNPRALYFDDDVYIGTVPGGDLMELVAFDERLGAVFYSFEAAPPSSQIQDNGSFIPQIRREHVRCLTCHVSRMTRDVPGLLVRSVFPGESGHPLYQLGTTPTDHTTDFQKRFGGWYVTGTHGTMRHRGNAIARDDRDHPLDYEQGANQTQIPSHVNRDLYLRPTSDLVALMVLEHQTAMHNAITTAHFETLRAMHQQHAMNAALGRAPDFISESTKRRLDQAAEQLLGALLFTKEYRLTDRVQGASSFAESFAQRGPFDRLGRSLREFDLQQRMFRYPCSYLIYSRSFQSLPEALLNRVWTRLDDILSGSDTSDAFLHLDREDRQNIRAILADTLPHVPWKQDGELTPH